MMSHFLRPLVLLVFLTGGAVVSVKASDNVIRCEYDNVCQATQKVMAAVNEMKNQQDERGGVQATDLEELKVKMDRSLASTAVISTQLEEQSGDLLSVEELLKAQNVCPDVNAIIDKIDAKASDIYRKLDAKASDIYSKQVKDVEELKAKFERSLASMAAISTQLETLSANLLRHDERLKTHDVSQTDQHKGADLCCPEIKNQLKAVNLEIEILQDLARDLRVKLGSSFKGSPSKNATCPPGFTYLPSIGNCYMVIFESHGWYSAGKKCQGLHRGSHLAAITSATENTAVKKFLASERSKKVKNIAACVPRDFPEYGDLFWTSGQRLVGNSCNSPFVWKPWSDKHLPFGFVNWRPGQPDCWRNSEHCMQIVPNRNFDWNDGPCNMSICPVCEYSP